MRDDDRCLGTMTQHVVYHRYSTVHGSLARFSALVGQVKVDKGVTQKVTPVRVGVCTQDTFRQSFIGFYPQGEPLCQRGYGLDCPRGWAGDDAVDVDSP